jgi:hypothetical protein
MCGFLCRSLADASQRIGDERAGRERETIESLHSRQILRLFGHRNPRQVQPISGRPRFPRQKARIADLNADIVVDMISFELEGARQPSKRYAARLSTICFAAPFGCTVMQPLFHPLRSPFKGCTSHAVASGAGMSVTFLITLRTVNRSRSFSA